MNAADCLLVGIHERYRATARKAAEAVFPGSISTTLNTLEEALQREPGLTIELLVLAEPEPAVLAKAAAAVDPMGLPRWAIVVLGSLPPVEGIDIISPEEWNVPLVTRVFRSAAAQHRLRRENASMTGDLRTVAHRISHDLRTPLSGIVSSGEALRELLADQDPASAALAKLLFDSVTDLGRLFDRVGMVTKASAQPVSKKPVAMEEVVWAVRQRLERQILKKNAVVTQPDSWPTVAGVPYWLEAVWWNLLTNALQQGKETIRIELGWSRTEREFRFWVRDSGPGVRAEMIHTLFQPFHLLYQPNATNGLGLSIVQRLVELQGGRCGYEPVATGGSTFFFTLPAGEPGDAPDASRHAAGVTTTSPSPATTPGPDVSRVTRT